MRIEDYIEILEELVQLGGFPCNKAKGPYLAPVIKQKGCTLPLASSSPASSASLSVISWDCDFILHSMSLSVKATAASSTVI